MPAGFKKFFSRSNSDAIAHEEESVEMRETAQNAAMSYISTMYALETVDAATVRPLAQGKASGRTGELMLTGTHHAATQIELCFGEWAFDALPTLRLLEPIAHLALSAVVTKALLAAGMRQIADLAKLNSNELAGIRGIGISHAEEVHRRLLEYVGAIPTAPICGIDYEAIIRSLFAALEPKKRHLLLASYGLEKLFPLSLQELFELQRNRRHELKNDATQELRQIVASCRDIHMPLLQKVLANIVSAFVRPWMQARHGIASAHEVMERLFELAKPRLTEERFEAIQRLIQDIGWNGSFWLPHFLPEIAPQFFVTSQARKDEVQSLSAFLSSLFWNSQATLSQRMLIDCARTAYARNGCELLEGFVERLLTLSPAFCLSKTVQSSVLVTLEFKGDSSVS